MNDEISRGKDKSVMSLWWLCIPLYLLVTILMKSLFMPSTTFISNLHDLTIEEKYACYIFFLFVPLVLIIFNSISLRNIYRLSGYPRFKVYFRTVWQNVVMIVISLFIVIIYSL